MSHPLIRRALAELVGTAFLLMTVIGSGIAAVRLSPSDVGLQLLENSLVTGAALLALILALQPVSAAFNPVVTLVERAFGAIDSRTAVVPIAAQIVGGLLGALLANLMFGLAAVPRPASNVSVSASNQPSPSCQSRASRGSPSVYRKRSRNGVTQSGDTDLGRLVDDSVGTPTVT